MNEDFKRNDELDPQVRWHRSLRWAAMGLAIGLIATAACAFFAGPGFRTATAPVGAPGGAASPGGDVRVLGGGSSGGVEAGKMTSARAEALQAVAVARMDFESEKEGKFDRALAAIRAIDYESDRNLGLLALADLTLPLETVQLLSWQKYPYDEAITEEQQTELLTDIRRVLDLANLASPGTVKIELMLRASSGKLALDRRVQGSSASAAASKSTNRMATGDIDAQTLIQEAESLAKTLPTPAKGFQLTWGLVLSGALAAFSYICSQIVAPIMTVLGKRAASFTAGIVRTKKTQTILDKDLENIAKGP